MSAGYLALILHAHLPFVRHPEHEDFLEENWLFEAITESYIPLLATMQRLSRDGVAFKLTMSLTPTLCSMLRDELLRERYVRYIERSIALAEQELERNRDDQHLRALSQFYVQAFSECRRRFVDEWKCDLVGAFCELQNAGHVEIIACAATHAYLPLLQCTPETVRAQIMIGRDEYGETFRRDPAGMWLPECGYTPALDPILQEANIRWFVLDSHGLMFANPRPRFAVYAPCYTPSGPAAFARDRDSSREVWNATEGYPGDATYRDFYRDAGFDLALEHLARFLPADETRRFTGLKFHRVTGPNRPKELYDPGVAKATAAKHAEDFVAKRREQLAQLAEHVCAPVIVAPFDAELFGHWWYEGPLFLEAVIRRASEAAHNLELTTPGEYLRKHPTQQSVVPASSSWGEGGYSEMWLNDTNAWVYPHLHSGSRRMTELARRFEQCATPLIDRALQQLARELLLAQSSDWAFLMKTATATEYATQRTKQQIRQFNQLHDQLISGEIDEESLAAIEQRDNLFPTVNWRYYIK